MARKITINNSRKKSPTPTPGEEDGDFDSPLGSLAGDDEGSEDQSESPRDGEDARLRRAAGNGQRRTHAAEDVDRAGRGDALVSTRRRNFRDEWTQEALPKLPPIPGYHLCWLSSTNQYDPISKRVRMGYIPVKPEELSEEFQHMTMKSGQWEGMIGVNEMLLYKIPMNLYNQIMAEFHHEGPLEEESSIRQRAEEFASEQVDSDGNSLVALEEGMKHLGRRPVRKPTFTG